MLQMPLNLYEISFPSGQSQTGLKDLLSSNRLSYKKPIVNIGISKFGKGLFAEDTIYKGNIVTRITGSPMKFDEAILLGEKESYPFQVDLYEYIAPYQNTIWQYINHSCNPNCGVNENLEIIALQDIKEGQELFYDYSTTMLEKHWTMKCGCNAANCRHIIADFDTLLPERQQYYLNKGVVQQFIKTYLKDTYA